MGGDFPFPLDFGVEGHPEGGALFSLRECTDLFTNKCVNLLFEHKNTITNKMKVFIDKHMK